METKQWALSVRKDRENKETKMVLEKKSNHKQQNKIRK